MNAADAVKVLLEDEEACRKCGSREIESDGDFHACMDCDAFWTYENGQYVDLTDDYDAQERFYGVNQYQPGEASYDFGPQPGDTPQRRDPYERDILGPDHAVDFRKWRGVTEPAEVPLEAKRAHQVFEHDPFIIVKLPADEEYIRREGWDMEHPVSGDTRVVTHDGLIPIRDLVGKQVKLLTRKIEEASAVWQEATVKSFGVQPLTAVTLRQENRQVVIRATAGHRWYIFNDGREALLERITESLVPQNEIPSVYGHESPWTVEKVEATGQSEEVFCAQVPETGVFVLENNILTGNCLLVAYKEYCERLRHGKQLQFSLVDTRDGLPKVNFEVSLTDSSYSGPVDEPVITQIRGKRNQCPPADEYLPALMAFFAEHPEWKLGGHGVRNFDRQTDGDKVIARWEQLQQETGGA